MQPFDHFAMDPFDLNRFVVAQQDVYDAAVRELGVGRKRTHWMWFIFPQFAGLGHSSMARLYAISSIQEAEAYLDHEVLGPRLRQCTELVLAIQDRSAEQIFGHVDTLKFRSSMTLFDHVTSTENLFGQAIERYFQGVADTKTLDLLK